MEGISAGFGEEGIGIGNLIVAVRVGGGECADGSADGFIFQDGGVGQRDVRGGNGCVFYGQDNGLRMYRSCSVCDGEGEGVGAADSFEVESIRGEELGSVVIELKLVGICSADGERMFVVG